MCLTWYRMFQRRYCVNLDLWVMRTVAKKLSSRACQVGPSCPVRRQLQMWRNTWLIMQSSFSAASSTCHQHALKRKHGHPTRENQAGPLQVDPASGARIT